MRVSAVLWVLLAGAGPLTGAAAEPEPSALTTATKEQYFSCLDAYDVITEKRVKLTEREQVHKDQATKFEAAEADLAAQIRRHAPSTKAELESYNKAIAKRNLSAQRFNHESRSLKVEQLALNDLIVATNTRCGGMLVSEELVQAATERRKRSQAAR